MRVGWARHLLATECDVRLVVGGDVVDVGHTRLDVPGDPGASLGVAGKDGAAETEVGVVCDADHLLFAFNLYYGGHGSEGLFPGRAHVVGDPREHYGAHQQSLDLAAEFALRARRLGVAHLLLNAL